MGASAALLLLAAGVLDGCGAASAPAHELFLLAKTFVTGRSATTPTPAPAPHEVVVQDGYHVIVRGVDENFTALRRRASTKLISASRYRDFTTMSLLSIEESASAQPTLQARVLQPATSQPEAQPAPLNPERLPAAENTPFGLDLPFRGMAPAGRLNELLSEYAVSANELEFMNVQAVRLPALPQRTGMWAARPLNLTGVLVKPTLFEHQRTGQQIMAFMGSNDTASDCLAADYVFRHSAAQAMWERICEAGRAAAPASARPLLSSVAAQTGHSTAPKGQPPMTHEHRPTPWASGKVRVLEGRSGTH
mmetsp:Transcript_39170/g.114396  ORF Transcript_39170/g.114396 Transcript_39170/m.114396 type:complete len:307 (+) Transcript_39170:278-1198(+)